VGLVFQKSAWVIVTLKNGSRVYGLFDKNSFAGNDPDRRDLYLEATFRVLDNDEWAPNQDTGGILILAEQIAMIDFRKWEEVSDE
jgi:hypothetical protein